MEFTIAAETLGSALTAFKGVVERRATLPTLANVLLSVEGSALTLTGTDLETQLQTTRTVQSSKPGAVTAPLERLLGIVRSLPDTDVRAKLDEDRLLITAGRSRFRIATIPAENYPAFTGAGYGELMVFEAATLARALGAVSHAMAKGDVRYFLNGLLLSVSPGVVRLVASDGHRLSVAEFAHDYAGAEVSCLFPRKAIFELVKLLPSGGDVSFRHAANAVEFTLASGTFATKLVEGKYPDWNRVVPRDLTRTLTVDRAALLAALRRVSVITEAPHGITFDLRTDGVALASQGGDDKAEDFVSGVLAGEPTLLGFNALYLEDALSHLESEMVEVAVTAQSNSCLITDPESDAVRHVVMPMRL